MQALDDNPPTNDESNDRPVGHFGTVTLICSQEESGHTYTLDVELDDLEAERIYCPMRGWVDLEGCELVEDLTGDCLDENGRHWTFEGRRWQRQRPNRVTVEEILMKTVNRSALVLRYKEPFIRWAERVFEKGDLDAVDFRSAVSVYLVPPDPKEEQESAPLDDLIPAIFENELEGWCTDPELWPARRDVQTFREWFDVAVESIVHDLGSGPIRRETY